jgi:hypothetical protein
MELVPSALLTLSVAQLKKIVQTATLNAEEVKAEISEYIQSAIDALDERLPLNKKKIESMKKLLDAVGGVKKSKAEKVMEKIIKSMANDNFKGVFEHDGKYCVCDGYRLFRFSAPLNGLPKAKGGLNTVQAIGDRSRYSVRLELPKLSELKQDIKIAKMGRTDAGRVHYVNHSDRRGHGYYIAYDFGYGLPAVDAELLVDMLAALPDCEAFAYPNGNYKGAPVYFVSGENDGLMLTVKKDTEWEPAPVVEMTSTTTPVMEVPAETVSTDTAENPAPIPDIPAETTPTPDNPAPVATSTPVQAAQDTAARDARQIVAAISPSLLRLFCAYVRDGCRPDGNGLDRTRPDGSGVSAQWTVDGTVMCNTS